MALIGRLTGRVDLLILGADGDCWMSESSLLIHLQATNPMTEWVVPPDSIFEGYERRILRTVTLMILDNFGDSSFMCICHLKNHWLDLAT